MNRHWGVARLALPGLVLFLCIAIGNAAGAVQKVVGVDEIRFAWAPVTGASEGYVVSVTRNDTPLTALSWVANSTATVRVSVGDRVAIAVQAAYRKSDGTIALGAYSPISDSVWVLSSPTFQASGQWTLTCSTCATSSVALRSLANASVIVAEAQGLPAPWRIAGRASLDSGPAQLVWHNPVTGVIALWDSEDLAPIPGGSAFGPVGATVVGGADFDGDGLEELVVHRTDTDKVELYALTSGGLERVAVLPGSSGARLVAAEDLNRNGTVELLWHSAARGTLDSTTVKDDPRDRISLSTRTLVSGALAASADVANLGDYDGDGDIDLLWRYASNGKLVVGYFAAGEPLSGFVTLPVAEGDATRGVVGSVDIDGVAGDEIALQDTYGKQMSVLFPRFATAPRVLVLNPGAQWFVANVAADAS